MKLRKGSAGDAEAVRSLIEERVAWMDEKGLNAWNRTGYLEIFTAGYFRRMAEDGSLYVLTEDSAIIGSAVILESDSRWPEGGSALYVHNLVAKEGCRGGGAFILSEAERMAKEMGKRYLRLDASASNAPLLGYYIEKGFHPSGTTEVGLYRGIRLEKRVY